MGRVRANLASRVKKGKMAQAAADAALARLAGALDYSSFGSVDMVIEAVIEDIPLKQRIFADLEKACRCVWWPGRACCLRAGHFGRRLLCAHPHQARRQLGICCPTQSLEALGPCCLPACNQTPPPSCRPDCILSTNTSTIDIDLVGANTRAQERIVGAHFFSPAHVMPLLEIVRTSRSSKQVRGPCCRC
jgi:enoyl-CoA hydratase/3-hydroxyacyl-CoA dehydrogenase